MAVKLENSLIETVAELEMSSTEVSLFANPYGFFLRITLKPRVE